jgi:hypothetical protein
LPANLRGGIYHAALELDLDRILSLLDEAEPLAPDVVHELRARAERFDFQNLIQLFQPDTVSK